MAINRKNTELAGEQVAITLEAEAFDKEKKLRSQIEDIQKINGIRKPDIRELQQTALKNPPKELQ